MLVLTRFPRSHDRKFSEIVLHDKITGEKIEISVAPGSSPSRIKVGITANHDRYVILRKEIEHIYHKEKEDDRSNEEDSRIQQEEDGNDQKGESEPPVCPSI